MFAATPARVARERERLFASHTAAALWFSFTLREGHPSIRKEPLIHAVESDSKVGEWKLFKVHVNFGASMGPAGYFGIPLCGNLFGTTLNYIEWGLLHELI